MKNFSSYLVVGIVLQLATISMNAQVLVDDFNRTNSTTVGGGWTEIETVAAGAQISSNRLILGSTTAGREWVYRDFNSLYTSTLSSNSSTITWAWNMRMTSTNPSGFDNSNYGMAYILGSTGNAVNSGSGYAVVVGQSGTTDPIRLVRFGTTGFDLNSDLTNIISGGDYGSEYLSVRVTYNPTGNNWSLFVESNASAFPQSDPRNTSTQIGSTTSDNTYTGSNLRYAGPFWNHSTSGTENAIFDDVYRPSSGVNVNGTIGTNEYGTHTDGNNQQSSGGVITYMTWDNTNLYIGIGNHNTTEAGLFFFDVNPVVPVNGGTNSDGSTTSLAYDRSTYNLPFRGDLALYFKSGYQEYRTANGSGGWNAAVTTGMTYNQSGAGASNSNEISIPWSVFPGGVRPTSFNWFGQKLYDVSASVNGVYGQVPTENPSCACNVAATTHNAVRYYTVSVTTVGSSTMPMSRNSYTHPFGVTNNSFGAITVWDFTMNSSGQQIARTNSGSQAWVINNDLIVNSGSVYFGSGGSGYGTTTIGGSVRVSGGLLSMDQTNQSMNVTGNVSIVGGTLTLSGTVGGDLALAGNWLFSSGTFNPSSRAVTFNSSTAAQTLTGNTTFDFLTINNTFSTPTLTLQASSAVTVNTNVNFVNGRIILGANNLTLGSSATVSTPTTAKYFVTNSTGLLIRPVSTSAVTFNVGNSSYNPVTLTPSAGSNVPYQVRVIDAVTSPAPFNSTKLINRYWSIAAPTAGANTLTMEGQWNTGEENANYSAGSQVKVAYNDGTSWTETNSSQVGSNPFTSSGAFSVSAANINSGITFGIGKDDGFINSAVTYTWNGSSSSDWATSTNWTPNGVPSSVDNVVISSAGTNTLSINSARTVVDFTVSGTGIFTTTSAGSLTVTGNISSSTSGSISLDCASTINISSASSQTIPAWNYGNLNTTGGARVWTNGATTGICGNFVAGAGAFTVTGSTVAFNGTAAQAINTDPASFATLNITNTTATVTANANVTASTAMTINSSAVFNQASGTLTVSNATVNINGTLRNSTSNNIVQTSAVITVGSTGTYDHNRNTAGAIITATWNAGSNCLISGAPNAAPNAGLGQSFSDFTWSAAMTAGFSLAGGLTTVNRDFIVTTTNSQNLGLTATTGLVLNVGRDLLIQGGILIGVTGANTNTVDINVADDLNISGAGSLIIAGPSSSGVATTTFDVADSVIVNSTSTTALVITDNSKVVTLTAGNSFNKLNTGTCSLVDGTGTGTLTITSGNFNISAGTFNMVSGSTGASVINQSSASHAMNLTGGTFNALASTAGSVTTANRPIINLSGSFNQSGTSTFEFAAGTVTSAANPMGELRVAKDFTRTGSGGMSVTSVNATNNALILFNGTTQNYDATGLTGDFSYVNSQVASGSVLTLLSDMTLYGNPQTVTVLSGGQIDFGTRIITSGASLGTTFTVNSGGTLKTANQYGFTTATTGSTGGSVQLNSRVYNSNSNYIFNGGSGQGTGNFLNGTTATANTINNLTIDNSSNVALDAPATVNGTLTLTNGHLVIGNNDLIATTISGAGSSKHIKTTGTGLLRQGVGSPGATGAILYPVGNSAYNPITLTSSATIDVYGIRVVDGAVANANDNTKSVNRSWVINEGIAGGSNLSVVAQYNSGEEGTNFGSATTPYIGFYKGSPNWVQQSATPAGSGPFTYTSGANFTPTDLTTGTQYFAVGKDDAFLAPVTSYSWNGSTDSNWNTTTNWTPNGTPGVTDDVVIDSTGANTLDLGSGSFSCTGLSIGGTGKFDISGNGTLTIAGAITYTSSATPTLSCGSTVVISSTSSVAIPAWDYGNLDASGGPRVLASSGTIGICGAFTRGAGAYTITGSTVDYKGTGAQSISAGLYNNLTISQNRGGAAITLPATTIDVAGTFNPSLSNFSVSVSTNTFNFSSSGSQNFPAFFYYNVTNSGNGARTWASSGIIDINNTFTPSTNTNTVTGSTVRYSSTSATAYTLTSFTSSASPRHYNNLELVGGASTTWTLASGFNLGCAGNFSLTGAGTFTVANNATANTMTVDGTLTLSGTGTVRVSNTATAATVGALNVTGNSTISNGILNLVGASAGTTVQGNFTTNDLTISGTGQLLLDAASNTSVATATVNGNLLVTSTTANAINLGSGTANTNNIINLKGNFTKSGTGTLGFTGTFTTTAGYNFNGTGTQQINFSGANMTAGSFFVAAGSTVQLASNISLGSNASASGFSTVGTGIIDFASYAISAGNAANTFALSSTGTFRTANASGVGGSLTSFTVGNCSFASGGTFDFTGTSVNTGFSTFTGITTSNAYTISWNGSTSLTLDKAMNLNVFNFTNSGLVFLGNFDITLTSAAGALTGTGFSSTKMFVTNGSGSLIRSVLAAGTGLPFTWPIGENTGSTEYSPVTIASIASAGINGSIGIRVVDGIQPNMSPAVSYISRYWPMNISGFNSTYTLSGASFTYDTGDVVVGPEASLKVNSYNSTLTAWTEYTSSVSSPIISTSALAGTSMPAGSIYDVTARIDVPVYYRSVSTGSWATASNWEVSSDPLFVSPAPVAAAVAPNSANSKAIFIRNTHDMSVSVTTTVDSVVVRSGGKITVTNNSFTIANGTGTDLTIDSGGTVEFASTSNNSFVTNTGSTIQVNGLMKQSSTASPDMTNNGTITIGATGTYEHARNAGIIPTCTWSSGSTCLLTGIINNTPTGLGQSFHHFTVNSTLGASVNCSGNLQTILGKFKLTTNNATNEFRLSTGTTYTLTVTDSLIINNGFLSIASGGSGPCNIVANGPVLVTNNSTLAKTGAATANFTFNNDFQLDAGSTFEFNNAGSSNTTANFRGNTVWNGTILRTNGGTHTINFDKSSGNQTLTSNATFGAGLFNINIGTGSTSNTLQLLSNLALSSSSHVVNVRNGATFNMGPYIISGTNTAFTVNATGAIKIGHPEGIVTAPTLDGNVQTLSRTFPGTSSYFYNGQADQETGNALPTTLTTTGNLNIESGSGIVVTLTNNNTTTPTFNLISGLFAAGNTQQLNITNNGTVNASGGDWVTGANAGLLNFPANGSFTGSCNPYNVHVSAGGVNFGTGTVTIQNGGRFRINAGGFVNTNAPFYGTGSTLQYNIGSTYGRNLEWSTSSGRGYPHHVQLSNNTTLDGANGGATGATPISTSGNLTIDSGSSLYLDFGGNNVTTDLVVAGDLNLTGNLSWSQASGADMFLGGNFTNNGATANLFTNNRALFLNGTGTQTFSGSYPLTFIFPFLLIDKTAGSVVLTRDVQVSTTLTFTSGNTAVVDAGAFTLNVTNNATGAISRVGLGHVKGNLRRAFATGTNTYLMTVGDSAIYAPVTIAANSVTVAGSMTAFTTPGEHSQISTAALDPTKSVNRTWTISQTGLSLTDYNPTFGFDASDVDGGANTNNFLVGRYNAGWTYPTVGTKTATSTQATGETGYGEFAVAECKTPDPYNVTGTGAYCAGGSGLPVGLDGSDSWISYQLQRDGSNVGSPMMGTGAAISFGNQTVAGTYTVIATNVASGSCTATMTGSAVITVTPNTPVDIVISSSAGNVICTGTSVTFSATATNPGVTPVYQWQLNGSNITTGTTYNTSTLNDDDVVTCLLYSSETCPLPVVDTSNVIVMEVYPIGTPNISISIAASTICAGTDAVFTATPTFGGTAPTYQWRLNGTPVGTNSNIYSNPSLVNGDQVDCILTSNYPCVAVASDTSNVITMTIIPAPVVDAGSDMSTCGLTAYTFANGATNSNTTGLSWTENGAGSITAGSTTLTPTYTPAAGDLGNVVKFYLTGTGNSPCTTAIDSVYLTVSALQLWYIDADGDGFGNPLSVPTASCTQPVGRVLDNTDCCDTNGDINPLCEWWADVDGDGYGSFIYSNGCISGCTLPAQLFPWYPPAHGGALYTVDCNDNNVNAYPGAPEICQNNADDDCDLTIDEGCSGIINDTWANAITLNVQNPNMWYPNCNIQNGTLVNADISIEANPSNVDVGGGRDIWYRFQAPSTGVQIKVVPTGFDAVIELRTAAHPAGQVDVESINNSVGGVEILNTNALTIGQVYFVGIRNKNNTNVGTFTLCVSPLMPSGCASVEPTGGYSLCSNFKATFRGALNYTFNFTGTGGAAAFPFVTTSATTTGLIPLSTPSLDIRYGGEYSARVDANYQLYNGLNAAEAIITINGSNTPTGNCNDIDIIAAPLVEVRANQRCPAVLNRNSFLIATPVTSGLNVCGAISYTYRFTQISACGGGTVGFPFTVTTSSSTPYLSLLAAFPSPSFPLANVGRWRVEVRPNFSYGSGSYGPAQDIQVNNTALSAMAPDSNEMIDSEKSDVATPAALVFPNPSNGEQVMISLMRLTGEQAAVSLTDASGRLVYERSFAVEGSLTTHLEFVQPLSAGVYFVKITSGDWTEVQRLFIEK